MDIDDFHYDWINNINVESANTSTGPHEVFFHEAIEQLVDSEEIDESVYNNIEHFEGIGKRNAKIKMDSFGFDPVDQSCTIAINYYSNSSKKTTITNTEIEKLYSNMQKLVEASVDGFILDPTNKYEISSSGYNFASEIKPKFHQGEITKFRLIIITDCVLSNRVKVIKKEPIEGIPVDLSIWDLNRFYNIFKSKQGKEDLNIDTTKEKGGGIRCVEAVEYDKYKSYLAVVSGKFLAELYLDYGSRLLEGNVRSFLSIRGKINKGIRYTILNDPDMFFTYNNGIAITATDIDVKKDENGDTRIIRIKDLQIINGGQTTASVANALIQDKAEELLDNLFIPAKITVLAKQEDADEIVPNISRYANSQNKIDEADFFSNSPYHVKLEEFSRKTPAPAIDGNQYQTYWFYERARGQYGQEQMKLTRSERKNFQTRNPKSQLIKKVDVAKYLNSYDYMRPDYVSKGAQTNMRLFAEEITKQVNKDSSMVWLNERYYKDLIAKAIIFKSTEKIVSEQKWYQEIKAYRANIVTYTIAVICEAINRKNEDYTINLQRIWSAQKIYPELEKQIKKTAKEVYDFITREDRPTQNVTEWCKREACWRNATEEDFELNQDFVKSLIRKDFANEEKEQAKKDEKVNNSISDQIKVTIQPSDYWKKFLDYCQKEKLTKYMENSCIMTAINKERTGRYPTEKQCAIIMNVYRRLEKDGSLPPELKIM